MATEGREWRREPPILCIELTDRQAQLYWRSATFKAGADAFVRQLAPIFLRGLEEEAAQQDARLRSLLESVKKNTELERRIFPQGWENP